MTHPAPVSPETRPGPNPNTDLAAILAARGGEYGDFTHQARIARWLKTIAMDAPSWNRMAPFQQEAMDMVLHKVARILNGNPNNVDSWADIAGYAKLAADRCADTTVVR